MDNGKFGEYLARLRKVKGYTQQELAKIIRCNNKTISKWETGKYMPDVMYLNDLAIALDVPVTTLMEAMQNEKEVTNNISLTSNIKDYKKRLITKIIAIVFIIIIIIISFFTLNIMYMKNKEWKVEYIESKDSYYYMEGSIIFNDHTTIYNLNTFRFDSEYVGTTEEPIIKSLEISLYDGDELVITENMQLEEESLIHNIIQDFFISETKEIKHNKQNIIQIKINYTDTNNEVENYIVTLEEK